MTRRLRQTTTTLLVEEALRGVDDFLSIAMLRLLTGRTRDQIHAALCHLRDHRVVDVVVNPDGTGWWFARPTSDDDRRRVIPETAMGVTKKRGQRRRRRRRDENGQ
jgi:predicted pyridoxine 5'-phosphate oxidase superfamily flavin-nucleotide-binding protein